MLIASVKQIQMLSSLPGLPPQIKSFMKSIAPLMGITNETNIEEILANPIAMAAIMQLASNESQALLNSEFIEFALIK